MNNRRWLYFGLFIGCVSIMMTIKAFIETTLDKSNFALWLMAELLVLWFWYVPAIALIILSIKCLKEKKECE